MNSKVRLTSGVSGAEATKPPKGRERRRREARPLEPTLTLRVIPPQQKPVRQDGRVSGALTVRFILPSKSKTVYGIGAEG